MRLNTLSASVLLCAFLVTELKASELKGLGVSGTLTPASFSIGNASGVFEGALPSHNETELGKFTIDNSDEEARVSIFTKPFKDVAQVIERHVGKSMAIWPVARSTNRKRKRLPVDDLVDEINLLQMKRQRTENDNKQLFSIIQQLQDHDEPHFQQTGAAELVDMLRYGANKGDHDTRHDIVTNIVVGVENKQLDQELLNEWIAYCAQWLYSDQLTTKQAQLYEALLTRMSENEIINLALAFKRVPGGTKPIIRLLLLMLADPVTRERAFRLQLLCGGTDGRFLKVLLFYNRQDPSGFILNVWLEFIAYTRFSKTFTDRAELRAFINRISDNLYQIASIPRPEQKEMFSAIVEKRKYKLSMKIKGSQWTRVFEWNPDDRDEVRQIKNNILNHEHIPAFMAALSNEAVIKSFRAAEIADEDQALAEAQKDPKVFDLLLVIIKNDDNFKLFKAALRDRQFKTFAEEFLQFLSASP